MKALAVVTERRGDKETIVIDHWHKRVSFTPQFLVSSPLASTIITIKTTSQTRQYIVTGAGPGYLIADLVEMQPVEATDNKAEGRE